MTPDSRRRLVARLALAIGLLLFLAALRTVDWSGLADHPWRSASAVLVAIATSGAWHALRTLALSRAFAGVPPVPLGRLARVRLAAEAVSYLTLRGVAGEPLKVVLLADRVPAVRSGAAVALERVVYGVGTAAILACAAAIAAWRLPMPPVWRRAMLAMAGAIAAMLIAAAWLMQRRTATRSPHEPTVTSGTIVAKSRAFVAAMFRTAVDVGHREPRVLVRLAVLTAGAYACMVVEVWAVCRVAGLPISLWQACAVETITRAASVVTAFIPANLGALEWSSLVAMSAVASPAGALLAAARRVRGLFWAAAGLAIYPAVRSRTDAARPLPAPSCGSGRTGLLLYCPESLGADVPHLRVAGLPIAERAVRAALRADYEAVVIFAPSGAWGRLSRLDARVHVVTDQRAWHRLLDTDVHRRVVTVMAAGVVASTTLLRRARHLPRRGAPAMESQPWDVPCGRGFPVSGLACVRYDRTEAPHVLAARMDARVRRTLFPPSESILAGDALLALRVDAREDAIRADQVMRLATYKSTDAKVARFNRRLSLPLSIALLRTPLTANMMSVFVAVLGLWSAVLFADGHYLTGVAGGCLSLAASILDGCDGEIARLKYQESALGCWLETIGDYSYYLAIFVGLALGAVRQTGWAGFQALGAAGLSGTLLSFMLLIYLRQRITNGRPETLHAVARDRFRAEPSLWSRVIWRVSFVATRAAMPYGILALALLDVLPLVVVLCAIGANVYWISLVLKLRQLLGEPVTRLDEVTT